MTKIGNPEYGKDPVYKIRILLAGIEIGHHIGIVRDINVGFMGPVEDFFPHADIRFFRRERVRR